MAQENKSKKKNIERYFGNNLATVFYLISGFLIAGGLVGIFFRFYIVPCAAVTIVGIVLFFITFRMKITDSDYDESLNKSIATYKTDHVANQVINRKHVDPEPYDLFYGYLFDQPGLKRKVGKDGKPRSTRYYIAALYADRVSFGISYSEYDVLTDDEKHVFIHGEQGDAVKLEKPAEKPAIGDYRYVLQLTKGTDEQTLVFHLPDDALVDEKMKLIGSL